jgi:hypothetical protein
MRYMWKGAWKSGEVTVEAEDPMELEEGIKNLAKIEGFQDMTSQVNTNIPSNSNLAAHQETPIITKTDCGDAIVEALTSEWGKKPRKISEIRETLESNARYFAKGTLSGMLTYYTKTGMLRRVEVEDGSWGYLLNKK